MSVLGVLSRLKQSLTTDAKPDPPRIIIEAPEVHLPSAEIKQKSAPVTPDPKQTGAIIPVIQRQRSTSNQSAQQSEFSNAGNFGFSGQSKAEPRPKSPRAKTKPKYKSPPNPNVVNYNIVNSNRVTICTKKSYNCNINSHPGNVNITAEGSPQKPKERPMPEDVEELSCSKEVITLDDMFSVKTHIGSGWRDVARRLGYSEGQIHQFEENHKYVDQVVYQILVDWKQANTKDAQIGKLISMIWLSQEYDCAERLAASHKTSA